jgi:glutamyl-tRNA synthetase
VIENGPENGVEAQSHPLHPKNASIGSKAVLYGKVVYIEKEDAETIIEGEKITLMKWGNVTISKKEVNPETGKITFTGKIDSADKDFKKTKKLTWIVADPDSIIEINVFEFDHLIAKPKLEEKDELKDHINPKSKV